MNENCDRRVDARPEAEPPPAGPNRQEAVPSPPARLGDRVRSLRLPETPAPAPRRAWVPWLLCLVLSASTAYLAWVAWRGGDAGPAAPPPARPTATAPGARPPLAADPGGVVLESKGYIIATHQIQVSPKVSGMVERLFIEEGKQVQKGDILAEIETTEYQADVDRAQAALESARRRLAELSRNHPDEIKQAKAELDEAEAQREQLYQEWRRNKSLQTGGALAVRDYEQAQASYQAMDRKVERLRLAYYLMKEGPRLDQIEAAKAQVRQAEADLVKARWRLDNCKVIAPVSGIILTKKAEEGNIVNPIAFNISASLCDMADLADLEVDLTIQERDIAKVSKGQRCRIRPEAFPDRVYDGHVSRLMPIADRAKGAIPVRVKIESVLLPKEEAGRPLKQEEGVYLKPEMGAIVSFLKNETR
jgi:multidrug resistance efflux pump